MRVFATAFGVILTVLGFFALVLSLVGVKLSFLVFLEANGRLFAFVAHLLMIIFGMVIVTLAQTNWESEMNPNQVEKQEN